MATRPRRCPRCARTASASPTRTGPVPERRPDRRRHDRHGRAARPGAARRRTRPRSRSTRTTRSNLVAGTNDYRVFNSPGAAQRQLGLGVHDVRRRQDLDQRAAAAPDLPDRRRPVRFAAMDSAGDPVVAFGPHNTVYYGNIVFSRARPARRAPRPRAGSSSTSPTTAACTGASPTIIAARRRRPGRHADVDAHLQRQDLARRRPAERHGVRELDPVRRQHRRQLPRVADHAVAASTDFGRTFGHRARVDADAGRLPRWHHAVLDQGSNPQVGNDGTLYIAYEGIECATAGL